MPTVLDPQIARLLVQLITDLLLLPDDPEHVDPEDERYDSCGLQALAVKVSYFLTTVQYHGTEWSSQLAPHATTLLKEVSALPTFPVPLLSDCTNPGVEDDPTHHARVRRVDTLQNVVRAAFPYNMKKVEGISDLAVVLQPYCDLEAEAGGKLFPLKNDCDGVMGTIRTAFPELLKAVVGMAQKSIDKLKNPDQQQAEVYRISDGVSYDAEPGPWNTEEAISVLFHLPGANFSMCYAVIVKIAQAVPAKFLTATSIRDPQKPAVVAFAEDEGTDPAALSVAVSILAQHVCERAPKETFELLSGVYGEAFLAKILEMPSMSDYYYTSLLKCAGMASAEAGDAMAEKLLAFLAADKCTSAFLPMLLSAVLNFFTASGNSQKLGPHMATLERHRGSAAVWVEKLVDLFHDRSLENMSNRMDALETMVKEMNDKIAQSCSNFEEVKAYVDKNIVQLKDFVGEVVKKLPMPTAMTVIGGVQKTIRLHFKCVRTGVEWTTESKEWSKWMKMGFSAVKVGACLFGISMGNFDGNPNPKPNSHPLALAQTPALTLTLDP